MRTGENKKEAEKVEEGKKGRNGDIEGRRGSKEKERRKGRMGDKREKRKTC